MDKLQKFFKRLWRYKERIVLAVLLCFLGYRVYELFMPKTAEVAAAAPTGEAERPLPAPVPPTPDAPGSYYNILHRSPFSYYSDKKVDGQLGESAEDLGLALLDIRQVGERLRVRLKTPGANSKWYDEGESFEEFVLEKVNPEEKTVEIYVERLARTVTVELSDG